MKRFAATWSVGKQGEKGLHVITGLEFLSAISEEEATGRMYKAVMKDYPVRDGYFNHAVLAKEIPEEPDEKE